MKRSIIILLLITMCLTACTTIELPKAQETTTALELDFLTTESTVELQAGEQYKNTFTVSVADTNFQLISTNNDVAEATVTKTLSGGLSYFAIDAKKAGTTDIYIQTEDGAVKSDKITITVLGYIYNIERVDDTSTANAVRKSVYCTADKDYIDSLDETEVREMVKYISKHYADTHSVNAVTSYLSYTGDSTDEGFTIASCLYAPFGDISKAGDVNTGDYTDFDYKVTIK